MKKTTLAIIAICLNIFLMTACRDEESPKPKPITYFPVLEASGSNYDIGFAIGKTFKSNISKSLTGMQNIYSLIDTLISTDPDRFYQQYVDTVSKIYPQFIDEIQGMADGSGFTFRALFISSMVPEYVQEILRTLLSAVCDSFSSQRKCRGLLL